MKPCTSLVYFLRAQSRFNQSLAIENQLGAEVQFKPSRTEIWSTWITKYGLYRFKVTYLCSQVSDRPLIDLWNNAQFEWDDLWHDCDLMDVIRYARGSKKLKVPKEWRPHLPSHL